ncbi:MAG: GNAT family N-acetyltransferase [Bacteroidaceae bacterium]|nr:GNAT family N-acetyltransferase [Bacteroidaceae bacterium]
MVYILQANEADSMIINQLAWQIFPETYCEILTPSQIDYMMEWMYSVSSLTQQMAQGHRYFLLCELNSEGRRKPCGYVSIEQEAPQLWHLQKIYVLPEKQGLGYGAALFRHAVAYIKELNTTKVRSGETAAPCGIELNVNRNNRARLFYERMGMHIVRQGNFPIGEGFFMQDYIMRLDV